MSIKIVTLFAGILTIIVYSKDIYGFLFSKSNEDFKSELSKGNSTEHHSVSYHYINDDSKSISIIYPDSYQKVKIVKSLRLETCVETYIYKEKRYISHIYFDHQKGIILVNIKPDTH